MLGRSNGRRSDLPAIAASVILCLALVVQLAHSYEHVLQIIQKYIWGRETFPGLLGAVFDFEWVHCLYNGELWLTLVAVWLIYRKNPGIWRPSTTADTALSFVVIFQGYHWFEHLVRMWQYYSGRPPTGLLGQLVPLLELHFWLNALVAVAMLVTLMGFKVWQFQDTTNRWPVKEGGDEAPMG